MNFELSEKVAIVTGATSNIGRAIALALAGEGARVIAVGRDEAAGEKLCALAMSRGASSMRFVAADLLGPGAQQMVLDASIQAFGTVDVLVNNLGGNAAMGHFAQSDPDSWQADLDITLMTTLRMTRAVLPGMIERDGGRIINIGSTAGDVGDYMLAVYSAAKGAVHTFTRVLAKEVGQHGITVNCVAPYLTLPDDPSAFSSGSRFQQAGFFAKAFEGIDPKELAKLQRTGPLERSIAKPEEVAAAVAYLASAQAAFVTGQIMHVDGGVLL